MRSIGGLIFMLLLNLPLMGDPQMADVTGDGVDDEIKVGEQSVVVIDGVSDKRFIVISGEEFISPSIDNYHPGIPGKEIAINFGPLASFTYTIIYGFKNSQFVPVSDTLPGWVTFSEEGDLWGYIHYPTLECGPVGLPYPIIEEKGLLKRAPITKQTEKTIEIDAGTTKEITIEVPKNTHLICVATVEAKNVIVSLKDEDSTISERKIDPENPFVGDIYADKDKTVTLSIDNSYSLITSKRVCYVITQYNYIPSKK